MRRRTFLAAAPLLAAAASGPARAGLLSSKRPEVDLLAIAADTGAPGIGGAVVTPKGIDFLQVAGVRRRGYTEVVREDDRWHLGSDTKPMTAALFGRYVDAGRTGWGARLPALFPDLKLDPAWNDTRIEDVLAHRAGFSDRGVVDVATLARAAADKRPAPVQRTELVSALLSRPPPLPQGGFAYSNAGYVVVGAAIERLAKASWEEAITGEVFHPLAMGSAGFGPPKGAEPWGHQLGEDGRLRPVDPADGAGDFPALFAPAGEVHASLADWARFARVFLNTGGGFLSEDTTIRLCRPWGGQDGDYGMAFQALANQGWAQGGPVLSKEGTNGLWHSLVQIAPSAGVAVLAVANAEAGGGREAVARTNLALLKAYAGLPEDTGPAGRD